MEKINVSAQAESLDEVLDFITRILSRAGADPKRQSGLLIAAEEVFVNIAGYAYPSGNGEVTVAAEAGQNGFIMEFSDEGTPYNPLERADPDISLSAEDRKIGGLGIYMVKKMMDETEYRYCGGRNILTLRKKIFI